MVKFKQVASLSELGPGQRKAVWLSGVKVMLTNVEGKVYATDEQCTHMQCSMMTGLLRDTVVVCPCHFAEFDVRDGKVLKGPATVDLPTYQVKIEGSNILVEEKPPEIV